MALFIIIIIFLLILSVFFGQYRFYHSVGKDKNQLFNQAGNTENVVHSEDLQKLPDAIINYLKKVGVEGKCKDCHLTVKQRGRIRQGANKKWMDFSAKQFMTSVPIGFIWAARAFPIFVKDKSILGFGEVKITFLGLFTIGEQQSAKTNTSALTRCLAELPLYPVAFLNKDIEWETVDENMVKAKITVDGTRAEGVFFFNKEGLIDRFESERYRGEALERFTGKMEGYKTLSGLLVPTKWKAIWNLEEGDFEYFDCEIIDYRID